MTTCAVEALGMATNLTPTGRYVRICDRTPIRVCEKGVRAYGMRDVAISPGDDFPKLAGGDGRPYQEAAIRLLDPGGVSTFRTREMRPGPASSPRRTQGPQVRDF